ncbi:hypothetical protein BJV85_001912 [Clostridium acetobutylicum]|uniref:Predicted esterase of alpha/beta hydrolase superfamily, YBBA B.subtilis ortholog n=1 Tax=Clostridium acetobutylicum (strain ATCC 824 / DSM 792 / JCM 1419 / IAM 19013 / LMG 5710 / NBRC 13948 / NRRL B-527 / VKM B-1787 / 2291 / W) TaxID=272562 RepID=Q97HP7_CLOAB|nr:MULTISPECIES: alpha/beta hydrolase [Clostridium]AAK79923.1 Predicted esterase of alpha/beta hydrolase superfamily, YBBA B.subtilis ortholog [Clostridium acetobutylicum ATCC 824]ADZ21016.1 esterase of alpha/beta hydrolase superfamily [Clostridium acetobutylicum EA 2018]AEI34117.1 esterase [Clostridium acetobutylicum DSM 1731]AWV79645.1 alpha/beta hydrolase [Clostridium acetobutylicum]MBC2394382.1 alpha/beta hydrolase [Clostridium acetobutylicum]
MQGRVYNGVLDKREYFVYLPPTYGKGDNHYSVIYMQDGDIVIKILNELMDLIENKSKKDVYDESIIVGVKPIVRNDDYTPWEAEAISKGSSEFGGRGDIYLNFLIKKLKPYIDNKYRTKKEKNFLLGYSLGGLISIFAIYKTECFSKVVSISGSLWYKGLIDFMEKSNPVNLDIKVMLMIGNKEGRSRNIYLKNSIISTEKALQILKKDLTPSNVVYSIEEGGHVDNILSRYYKTILWLNEK